MVQVDGGTLKATVQTYRGDRAETQARVIGALNPVIGETLATYAIGTPLRVAHFLAQVCVECADFTAMEEIGPRSYFDQYNGRMGNQPPDDGYLFRGRGLIQLTGRHNYTYYGPRVGVDLVSDPDAAADPVTALRIACEYWTAAGLNGLADQDDLVDITRRINGGLNGLEQRRAYLVRAKSALAGATAQSMVQAQPLMASDPILHRGSTMAQVVDLQRLLGRAGFPVTVDGIFGSGTELAVRLFQQQRCPPVDGIVGPVTWQALRGSLAS
ncbi:peptidoglycan-binding protein [Azospirillum sp. B4]|uniref:peptidoglycan-binding protein n=1 Tax=Azospirillum sp. B4 TaxID=95605 RepID=UPI000345A925|nr:peptidoglycan-binding protein [Azospirillum sp. B4]